MGYRSIVRFQKTQAALLLLKEVGYKIPLTLQGDKGDRSVCQRMDEGDRFNVVNRALNLLREAGYRIPLNLSEEDYEASVQKIINSALNPDGLLIDSIIYLAKKKGKRTKHLIEEANELMSHWGAVSMPPKAIYKGRRRKITGLELLALAQCLEVYNLGDLIPLCLGQ